MKLIKDSIEADKAKQEEFFDLAERFRQETDPQAAKYLGDELGVIVFNS